MIEVENQGIAFAAIHAAARNLVIANKSADGRLSLQLEIQLTPKFFRRHATVVGPIIFGAVGAHLSSDMVAGDGIEPSQGRL